MDKVKQWGALTALAAVALFAGGWFLLVAPARGEAAELREQTALQDGTNAQLETSLEVLRTKAAGLPAEQAELAEVARRIPPGPALPELLRALETAADAAGVDLTSVTPAPPMVVEAPAAAAAVPADPATAEQPAPPPAAPAPTGLSSLEVKIGVVGDFYAVEQFVALLEELPRALRVTALSMQPGSGALEEQPAAGKDSRVQATLTGLVYLAPPTAPAAGAAGAPPAPAGGPVPAPATSSDSAPAS